MTELTKRPRTAVSEEQKRALAGMWVLKKLDLKPDDGGMEIPVVLPHELEPLDGILEDLAVAGLIQVNAKKRRWEITPRGYEYIGGLIDEAAELVEEFEETDLPEAIAELRRRRIDVLRARFLWGWYEGEFDDLVLFQERRGVSPVERSVADYLLSDDFYDNLALDLVEE